MLSELEIKKRLSENFPDADIEVHDLTGGGDHWDVRITSPAFAGKSLVEQHQMVYRSLGAWMKKEIHALKLHTSQG